MGRPERRRWVRRIGIVLGSLVLLVLAVYGWAWASLDRSTVARAMVWMDADVDDQFRFPSRSIPAGPDESSLPGGTEIEIETRGASDFDASLRVNNTLAFVVVHEDELVYERYFDGSDRQTLQTSFSVAKSVLSTLVGIAIDEGLIESVDDPVTDYLPELTERDRGFELITIRDLLAMSSGLRYEEPAIPVPWGDDVVTYYGVDLRDVGLNGADIEDAPGEEWHYNNYNPLLLGMVLERVTGTTVSDYAATRLWKPLGAESDASWSIDSTRSGFEKMESGFNATAVDYARFGLLYLHDGEWNGTQIVSRDWVRDATAAETSGDPAPHYQYYWWNDTERPGRFYGLGNLGQYVYVAPDADAVIVRLGRDWGVENEAWLDSFREIADRLSNRG